MWTRGIITCVFLFLWQGVPGLSSDLSYRGPHPLRDTLNEETLSFWDVYLPTKVDPSSTCGRGIAEMQYALSSVNITWAHQMMDSWGKHVDGTLLGFEPYFGRYDECRRTIQHEFNGRSCKIMTKTFIPGDDPMTNALMQEKDHIPQPLGIPVEVRGGVDDFLGTLQNNTEFSYMTCIPSSCTHEDLENSLMITFNDTNIDLQWVDCHDDYESPNFTAGDIAYISVLSIFGLLLVSSSLVDIYIQKTDNKTLAKGGVRYLLPFSAYTNIQKLFHINPESTPGNITCLHGMRVLSMTWVVYAHQQSASFSYMINFFTMIERYSSEISILYQAILNGFPSVDTFFFMSGFLLSYSVFREFGRTKRFNIVLFYVHRMLRLIPPIAIVAGLYATITRFFIVGPTAEYWSYWRSGCTEGWWRDVIFIDNFAIRAEKPMCLGQCWYLAVDTQLYIIAPLILVPILYKETLGLIWLYICTMVSIIVPAVITYVEELPPASLLGDPNGQDVMSLRYAMPWCRAGPVFIGFWLGYFFQKQGKTKAKFQPWQVLVGWTVASMTGLIVVFGLYSYNTLLAKAHYDVMTAVLYASLHRPAWAMALSWVVFACHNGYGGFIDDFLSHPIWQPMSRLTYSIYLVAMPLQYAIIYQAKTPFYCTYYNIIFQTVGALIIAVIPAVLVSITVESPIIGLEKLILKRPGPKPAVPKKLETETLKGEENKSFEGQEMKEFDENEKINGNIKGTLEVVTSLPSNHD